MYPFDDLGLAIDWEMGINIIYSGGVSNNRTF
jgi:hypothetical protein